MGRSAPVTYGTGWARLEAGGASLAGPGGSRREGGQADMGRCIRIDCSRPTASHVANIEEPP